MEITSKTLKAYKEFLGYKNKIDYELKEKGLYGIDILLMSYSVHDTIDFLQENSETFRILTITDNSKIDEFYKYFISLKNRYQQEINLPDRQSLLLLISKSKQNSKIVFPKHNISFVNTENREEYINRIIRRLKDCVNLYYSAYYNQEIYAELSNGEYTYLKFLEENLPHILGINKNQILMNSEAKRVLNIPQTEMPDIIVSKNGSNTIFSPQEQFEMYLSLLTDFNGGMDLNDLYQELIQFANSYEARVAEQMNNKGKNK